MRKLIIFLIVFFCGFQVAFAADYDIWGWAWSDNYGWVSFNRYNYYNTSDVNSRTNASCPDYGVHIREADGEENGVPYFAGDLYGYAWSSSLGWITFNKADLSGCPSVSNCKPKVDIDPASSTYGKHSGWAKVLLPKKYEFHDWPIATFSAPGITDEDEVAQTFTIGAVGDNESFGVASIRIKVRKTSADIPGNLIGSIRNTDNAGRPTGNDICSGSILINSIPRTKLGSEYLDPSVLNWQNDSENGWKWANIPITNGNCQLQPNQRYAIVIKSSEPASDLSWVGDYTCSVSNPSDPWCNPSDPDYSGGRPYYNDNNLGWNVVGSMKDFYFEIMGFPPDYWISLSCSNMGTCGTSNYRVYVDPFTTDVQGTSQLKDWAFNDDFGWFSFNCSNTDTCGTSDYKVVTNLPMTPPNEGPTANGLTVTEGNYCESIAPIFLGWTFSDPDAGDTQGAYQIQVDNSASFNSPEADSGIVSSNSNTYAPSGLSDNTNYHWRIKVWDNRGASSDWISGGSFPTDPRWPRPAFAWSPQNPDMGDLIQFANNTQYCASCDYMWDFGDGHGSDQAEPTHIYSIPQTYIVSLSASSGLRSCSLTANLNARMRLPTWREINPF